MIKEPRFSVIIPLFNKEKDIQATLESLNQQRFEHFEIIVVDDGSTDNGPAIVEAFEDPRLRFFSKENEGVAPTRNFGVRQAKAPFIAFLDADDFWAPSHLDDLDDLIARFPEGQWFATAYEKRINENLIVPLQSPIMHENPDFKGPIKNFFSQSFADCIAWTSAVCFRKDFFEQLEGFDTSITMGAGEDTDLWLRAALASPLIFSAKVSATHNLEGSNRITLSPTKERVFWNMDRYEKEAVNRPALKKYLDINRFSIGLQYRMAGDKKTATTYWDKIDPNHLSWKQKLMTKVPLWVLKRLYGLKKRAEASGKRLSSFEA